jgi:hypothetical protein
MNKYYLRIEGVNLSNFVYDTQDLSTIRGSGLAILEAVNIFDDKTGNKTIAGFPLTKISTGASAGMFEFEVKDGSTFDQEKFCQAVRDELNKPENIFRYATFVIDVLPASGDFPLDREKVLAKNRWQQMQSPRFVFPRKNDNKLVCEVDLVSPAKDQKEKIKGEDKFVSESVFQRREYGKKQKKVFVKNELNKLNDIEFINHFDSLTDNKNKGNLHHKMAVIYLDGNDFGKKQRKLSIEELKNFDEVKTDSQRRFLASLIERVIKDDDWRINKDGKIQYQMEILLWGGDEICLVVPAWKGWEAVELFYKETEELFFPDKGSPNKVELTHSIGTVFCHHNAPIRRIKKLAEDLAGLAKDKSREHNYFAYEILESFDHISKDLEEHRKQRCPQDGSPNAKDLILDGNNIAQITSEMKKFMKFMPKRKLNQIVQKLLRKDKYAEATSIIEKVKAEFEGDYDISKIAESLGGEPVCWTHALALWDFIEEQN